MSITQLKTDFFKRNGYRTSVFRFMDSYMPVAELQFADQLIIDNQVEKSVNEGIDIYKPQLKIVADYIKSLNDYNDAIDNIHKIYSELDSEKNADYLTQVLFAADITGHLSFQSEIEKEKSKSQALSFYRFQCKLTDNVNKLLTLCFDKPPEDAIDFLKSKKIEINWNWREQEELIKRHSFTVAKVSNADILQDIQDSLVNALNEGKPYDSFQQEIQDKLIDKGYSRKEDGSAWRLDNIYRTNLQSSFMAGRYKGQIEVAEDFPYWEYVSVMDSRTRDSHAALNETILRYDNDFWKTHYPPAGFSCRCRVVVYNGRTLKRDGKQITKNVPDIEADEGFRNNPAVAWKPDISKYSTQISKELIEDIKGKLTKEEIDALDLYSSYTYTEINNTLRKKPNDYDKTSYLGEQITKIKGIIDKHGKAVEGDLYRGVKIFKEYPQEFAQYIETNFKKGEKIVMNGFVSTSINKKMAESFITSEFGILFTLKNVKKGIDMHGLTRYATDEEILLNHQSEFKVIKITKPKGKKQVCKIELEQIL